MGMYLTDDDIDFNSYMAMTEYETRVKDMRLTIDELIEEVNHPPVDKSTVMPWPTSADSFSFRPGEVTVWAGSNGGGKSLMTGQVALGLIKQKQKICIASFEMKPKMTAKRMVRQFAGKSLESDNYVQTPREQKLEALLRFKTFIANNMYVYDQQGTVDAKRIEALVWHCATKLEIDHVFIDSLMKCVPGEDAYNDQKNFVDKLTSLARDHDIHIHLVHHIRKLSNEEIRPSKSDLRGSSAITDQVDNVLIVHRNKRKEHARESGKDYDEMDPDAYLMCEKQRNGEGEPWFDLWYHKDSQQFLDRRNGMPMAFDQTGEF
jgi:twinkle protein